MLTLTPPASTLCHHLGYVFVSPAYLLQALTHRSYGVENNERLEFLGDSILNCVIAQCLFERFPQLKEGDLSRLRAHLVRQDTLAELAKTLHLGSALRLGEGELRSGGAQRPSILADALEAVFAAVYLDSGFPAAKNIIEKLFAQHIQRIDPARLLKDPKTALQEWLQSRKAALPLYETVRVTGEDHSQVFQVECRVYKYDIAAIGQGASRRVAEQNAAQAVLNLLVGHKHGTK